MSIQIDKETAERVLVAEAERAHIDPGPAGWVQRIGALSEACESTSKTHIAFLGTAILAKAVDPRADVFAVKAGASTAGAYSARGLGHGVLVPLAPVLGIDLGVSGREPLNNQPYFRIYRATAEEVLPLVKDAAPVRVMLEILEHLQQGSSDEAREALRSFISVRRQYRREYPARESPIGALAVAELQVAITTLVRADSEGGKRAQAAVAGLLDAVFGTARVEAGRVNDPDRHLPGDVGVSRVDDAATWDRALEVRDKPVSEADLILFARKAAEEGVRIAAVVAAAEKQPAIRTEHAIEWAKEVGVELTVFVGWVQIIREAVFWAPHPESETILRAVDAIRARLVDVEASQSAVAQWDQLTAVGSVDEDYSHR